MDNVFRALADPSRRRLLDRLQAQSGQTLGELCAQMGMTRQGVSKHLSVLEEAHLVASVRRGREKLHYLNPLPISEIYARWIGKYERDRVQALADLKRALEAGPVEATDAPGFVYVTYIATTLQALWTALTQGEYTRRYWAGARVASDWAVGGPVTFMVADGDAPTIEGKVLEYTPPRRLAYTWAPVAHGGPLDEPPSRVTFELEPAGAVVRLTLTHDHIERGSRVCKDIRGGWPAVLSGLKTLLESGTPLHL